MLLASGEVERSPHQEQAATGVEHDPDDKKDSQHPVDTDLVRGVAAGGADDGDSGLNSVPVKPATELGGDMQQERDT